MALAGEFPPTRTATNGLLNPSAFSHLPSAAKSTGQIEAALIEFDIDGKVEKPLWLFLVNPASLQFTDQAQYGSVSPIASKVAQRFYQSARGATLKIPDLLFYTYCEGKSVLPLIDGARALLRATPDKGKFAPPVLQFRMGTRKFGPCILTQVDWEERAWLGGDPARVKMSVTLEEIPKPLTKAELEAKARAKSESEQALNDASGKPKLPLTQRQKEDASKAAKDYLAKNVDQLDPSTQALIKQSRYKLATDEKSGDVTMTDASGNKVGVVLRSLGDNKILANPKITTIPLKSGGKLPELKS